MSAALPSGWEHAPLDRLVSLIASGRRPRGGVRGIATGVLSLGGEHVAGDGGLRLDRPRYVPDAFADTIPNASIRAGDILVVKDGATTGRVGMVSGRDVSGKACVNEHLFLCRAHPEVDARYLFHFLRSSAGKERILSDFRGAAQGGISRAFASKTILPVPPLREQRRIVAGIEAFAARVSRARAGISPAFELIERYRRSVLSAAFRGDPASDPKGGGASPGWKTQPFKELLVEGPTNGFSPPASDDGSGTLSLRLSATTRGVLDLSPRAVKRLNQVIPPESKFWLRPGDVLIQRANSLEHVGAAAIFEGPENTYVYPDLMMRVRVGRPELGTYLWRYLNSASARSYFRRNATGTAGNMPKISGRILKDLPVPTPPAEELSGIVDGLDAAFKGMEAFSRELERVGVLFENLEQSILAKAFSGRLVPQDPEDEPASVLLARIHAERLRQPARSAGGSERSERRRA